MKNFRVDIVIAVCALLISALATGASWWQTRIIQRQLSAQVWPYLSFTNTYGPDSIDIVVSNDGLGPAIIHSLDITVDGKPQRDVATALDALLGNVTFPRREKLGFDSSTIGSGGVLAVGAKQTLLHVQGATIARIAASRMSHADMHACYCAIVVGDCWDTHANGVSPVPVSACPNDSHHINDPAIGEIRALLKRHLAAAK